MKKYLTKNNILYFLGLIIIGVLIVLIVRISYAYMAPTFEDAYSNVRVESDTVDEFKFSGGDPLSLEATSTTLAEGGSNIETTTTAKASLKMSTSRVGTENNSITKTYYVYANIKNNSFVYSKDTNPEIILKVSVDGNELFYIEGLTYGTFNGVSGFDVTTKRDNYLIASKSITSTSATEFTDQNWEFKLIYINQNYDQSINYGNSMNIEIRMEKEKKFLAYHEECNDNTLACTIAKKTTVSSSGLYYHDTSLTNGAGDYTYRYAGSSYKLTDNASTYSNVNDTSSTANGFIKMYCSIGPYYSHVGKDCSSSGETKYYYLASDTETHYDTHYDAIQAALNGGYIEPYVTNYICFNYDDPTKTYAKNWCPEDNLYRIIGVFNEDVIGSDGNPTGSKEKRVKLIKNTKLGSSGIKWDENQNNIWKTATLNTATLNGTYLTNLDKGLTTPVWKSKIATNRWHVSGIRKASLTPSLVYRNEIVSPAKPVTYDAKIGLMYVSDYGFAASPANWTTAMYPDYDNDTNINNNWMYYLGLGKNEWTITPSTHSQLSAVSVSGSGDLFFDAGVANQFAVRPSFYLESSTIYAGGTGTASDPIRIN